MPRLFKRNLLVLFGIFSLTFYSSIFVASGFSSLSNDCVQCHTDSTGMEITASQVYFEIDPSDTFALNITATGIIGKFPSEVADNPLFGYRGLDEEGTVHDNDHKDYDYDSEEIAIHYLITAPDTPGYYTLKFYAANNGGRAISVEITISVLEVIPTSTDNIFSFFARIAGPYINFLFSWAFLFLLVLGLTYALNRWSLKNKLYLVGIIIATFGWAAYYLFGLDPLSALLGLGGFLLSIFAERKARVGKKTHSVNDNQ